MEQERAEEAVQFEVIPLSALSWGFKKLTQYQRDVVTRSHKVLGPQHPDTLKAIMNLAILLDRTGRREEAEAMYSTALEGREARLGLDNPYTLRTVERLAGLLWAREKFVEAEELALRGLRALHGGRRGSLENQLRSLNIDTRGVGSILAEEGSSTYKASELLFQQAMARDEAALNSSHIDVIDVVKGLIRVYKKQGRHDEMDLLKKRLPEGCKM